MKLSTLILLLLFGHQILGQKVEKGQNIVTGTVVDSIMDEKYGNQVSTINYSFYAQPTKAYQKEANRLIYDYIKGLLIDTLYDPPMPQQISSSYFRHALNNFFQAYMNLTEEYGQTPPCWVITDIKIDEKTLKNNVQVIQTSGIYTGGAHPNKYDIYSVINKKSGKTLSWKDLLKDSVKFTKVAEKYFREVEGLKENDDYSSYFFESGSFELSKNFDFGKNEIRLIYLPYEAREWARGIILVTIPKTAIKKYLHFKW